MFIYAYVLVILSLDTLEARGIGQSLKGSSKGWVTTERTRNLATSKYNRGKWDIHNTPSGGYRATPLMVESICKA